MRENFVVLEKQSQINNLKSDNERSGRLQNEVVLTPSPNGELCAANGSDKEIEIQCDECSHYLECFEVGKNFQIIHQQN